ncbi:hypothetical protein J3F84DRAFT_221373 [Trichoderma pleuroticola]
MDTSDDPFSVSSWLRHSHVPIHRSAAVTTAAAQRLPTPKKGCSSRSKEFGRPVPLEHQEGVQACSPGGCAYLIPQLTNSRPPLYLTRANLVVQPLSSWFEILWANHHRFPPRALWLSRSSQAHISQIHDRSSQGAQGQTDRWPSSNLIVLSCPPCKAAVIALYVGLGRTIWNCETHVSRVVNGLARHPKPLISPVSPIADRLSSRSSIGHDGSRPSSPKGAMIGRLAITLPLRVIIFGHAWNLHACCKKRKSDNNHHPELTARHDTRCDSCRVLQCSSFLSSPTILPSSCVRMTAPALLGFPIPWPCLTLFASSRTVSPLQARPNNMHRKSMKC